MVSFEKANVHLNICVLIDLICHYPFHGNMAFILSPFPLLET